MDNYDVDAILFLHIYIIVYLRVVYKMLLLSIHSHKVITKLAVEKMCIKFVHSDCRLH